MKEFIVRVQYLGESTWYYYATCESEAEAVSLCEKLDTERPGKVRYSRFSIEM